VPAELRSERHGDRDRIDAKLHPAASTVDAVIRVGIVVNLIVVPIGVPPK
jgi:hypothetical protein